MPFKDKEKQKEYFDQYKLEHREEIREKDKIRYSKRKSYVKDRAKKRYIENVDIIKERKKQWYQLNKERIRSLSRDHYEENKEQIKAQVKEYCRKNPIKVKNTSLKYKFGISIEEYNDLLSLQEGKCAICGSIETGRSDTKYLHVDHDHLSGKVRGLLCNKCNIGIGLFNDDIFRLKKAIIYLERA
jgi:hypothetical protein